MELHAIKSVAIWTIFEEKNNKQTEWLTAVSSHAPSYERH